MEANHTDRLNQAAALITSILTTAQQSTSPARSNLSSVDGEIATLFRQANSTQPSSSRPQQPPSTRQRVRQNFSSWASGSRRRRPTSVEYHDRYNKDVILLPDQTWEFVCKKKSKQFLHSNGHILSAFEFHKSWNQLTLFRQIRDEFKPRISEDVSLQFLMACGNKLVTPKLKEGQEFDGHMIHKVFRSKALYVKPSVSILGYNSDTEDQSSAIQEGPSTRSKLRATHLREDSSEEGHSDGLIIDETATSSLPLNSYLHTTSSPPHTTNSSFSFSFSSSVVPVTTSVTSSVTASSSTIAPTSDYSSYVTLMRDVSDLSSDDEDLNRAIQASLQTEQTQATQHASVQEILSELADKISGNSRCKSNINRSAVLDGAFRSFNRATYNPNATMNIKFFDDLGRNEEAVDLGGPRREFLRLLMEALMMSFMFEGSEYSQNLALDIPGNV
ncbi:G2/M phase-specific E3 ubiquitin-protein ligase [Dissostichus eleginoides]|uniref:G2/M phase-specific E3 ubiquitin-protein ligase n=1 Tax=Dissostichus eleginoides TaxID=100907 RepID=A0AAD9C068_DISEL|nr:G2/M phase-specific E3 ubiquitin-protein ligase [Dissostichus eleginoides]